MFWCADALLLLFLFVFLFLLSFLFLFLFSGASDQSESVRPELQLRQGRQCGYTEPCRLPQEEACNAALRGGRRGC